MSLVSSVMGFCQNLGQVGYKCPSACYDSNGGIPFFFFQFSNLLGSVYKKGNVLFTPDGNSVISPVGNRVSIFDLKK